MSSRAIPIVALDVDNSEAALQLVDDLGDSCRWYKIGGELYTSEGPPVVRAVQARGASVFLDLKFHDIPNTVRGATRAAATLGVRLVTVHASGGAAIVEAAAAGVRDAATGCEVLAVTVLTSMDADSLSSAWGRRTENVEAEVLRLTKLAADAGAHGIVCSGHEAVAVRKRFSESLAILVPGVRMKGGDRQDQSRVVTPGDAAKAGATYIVVGRAVTGAKAPRNAMLEVLADLS